MAHYHARTLREAAYAELPVLDDAFDEITDPADVLVICDEYGAVHHHLTPTKDVYHE